MGALVALPSSSNAITSGGVRLNQFIGATDASFFTTKGLNTLSKSETDVDALAGDGEADEGPTVGSGDDFLGFLKKLAMRLRDLDCASFAFCSASFAFFSLSSFTALFSSRSFS